MAVISKNQRTMQNLLVGAAEERLTERGFNVKVNPVFISKLDIKEIRYSLFSSIPRMLSVEIAPGSLDISSLSFFKELDLELTGRLQFANVGFLMPTDTTAIVFVGYKAKLNFIGLNKSIEFSFIETTTNVTKKWQTMDKVAA